MEKIRSATADFLTQIQGNLTAEEKANLKTLAKNSGTAPYYLYLRELVYKKQLFMAVPPELAQYMEYIHTAQTMGMDRVTHEARELAFRIKLGLAHSTADSHNSRFATRQIRNTADSQTSGNPSGPSYANPSLANPQSANLTSANPASDLVQVQHDLDLLLRLADLQATEYEVRDFAPRLNQFVALTKSLLAKSTFDETCHPPPHLLVDRLLRDGAHAQQAHDREHADAVGKGRRRNGQCATGNESRRQKASRHST